RRRRLVMRLPVALTLLVLGASGCGGGKDEATDVPNTSTKAMDGGCGVGVHELTLPNGQAARMPVTPDSGRARGLVVALHGAGGTPAGGMEAFRGAWTTPG